MGLSIPTTYLVYLVSRNCIVVKHNYYLDLPRGIGNEDTLE